MSNTPEMELELIRTYLEGGTNGEIFLQGLWVCSSIESPRVNNTKVVSCIPEGRYELMIRYSHRLEWHLQLKGVKGRLILIHPACNELSDLQGCIAPVCVLEGEGKDAKSRMAFEKLMKTVLPALDKNQPVFLTIKSLKTAEGIMPAFDSEAEINCNHEPNY